MEKENSEQQIITPYLEVKEKYKGHFDYVETEINELKKSNACINDKISSYEVQINNINDILNSKEIKKLNFFSGTIKKLPLIISKTRCGISIEKLKKEQNKIQERLSDREIVELLLMNTVSYEAERVEKDRIEQSKQLRKNKM